MGLFGCRNRCHNSPGISDELRQSQIHRRISGFIGGQQRIGPQIYILYHIRALGGRP